MGRNTVKSKDTPESNITVAGLMNTDKIWIRDAAEICAAKGVGKVIISPGSRSAPLVIAFSRQPGIECIPIIDERCAAFFALGIAQQTASPVALVCTSGSASLNYAPAIAEAYYQRIPLIVFTSDRPQELIEQRDGQTIRQENIYHNYIRKSFQLPTTCATPDDRWFSARMLSEALNASVYPVCGPVHINVPLREPLYALNDDEDYEKPRVITQQASAYALTKDLVISLQKEWSSFKSKMIIIGASPINSPNENFKELVSDPSLIVLTESTSNFHANGVIPCIDPALEAIPKEKRESFIPELVVTIGGEIVSKKIKAFLRTNRPKAHWHVDITGDHVDTFKGLTKVLQIPIEDFLEIISKAEKQNAEFRDRWNAAYNSAKEIRQQTLETAPFCDLTVFDFLLKSLPKECNLHLGNSTPVRYANLFEINPAIQVNCNRGTSGIEGTVSTAAGAAYVNEKLTVLITGDIGFIYDSNGLWNNNLPSNLRVVVINNSGGNIFRIIPGPPSLDELEELFETHTNVSIEQIAKAFSVSYYFCNDMKSLKTTFEKFVQPSEKTAVLEIKTPNKASAEVLRQYMNM